jgi:competence protein ComEA
MTINEALARHRYALILILALALFGAVGYGLAHRPPSLELTVLPPQPTPLPTPVPTPGPIRCHVVGPVNAPGVYALPFGSRVQDALQAAGGPTADADLERLNLAAVVQDQDQIIVPRRTVGLMPGTSPAVRGPSTDLVNVNTADNETLQTLPGIGPALAGRIIDYRNANGPFDTIESLVEVKGIGTATLEKLRLLITVGP